MATSPAPTASDADLGVAEPVWAGRTQLRSAHTAVMQHNGPMLMGNKRTQRITVGVVIGVMVLSIALTLISTAIG